MGGTASILSSLQNIRPQKLVLLGSPTDLNQILLSFCKYLNFSPKATKRFFEIMKKETMLSAKDFNPEVFSNDLLGIKGLIVHGLEDLEVPLEHSKRLSQNWKGSQLILAEGLGHNQIMRSQRIVDDVLNFVRINKEDENNPN